MINIEGARQRILELEEQIELLKAKATAAGTHISPPRPNSHLNNIIQRVEYILTDNSG